MIIKPRYNGPQFWDGGKSLDLYFARDKSLDPRITFTRSSVATYFDADGVLQTAATDEARFTHNPVTGESLGLLVEGAATNLLTYSEDFSNAAWVKEQATITTNAAVAPDGTLTMDAIYDDTNFARHWAYQAVGGASRTRSIFAKEGTLRYFSLSASTGTTYAVFDLQTGVVSTTVGCSAKIEPIGNGVYRCSIADPVATNGFTAVKLGTTAANANPDIQYTGTGTGFIYIWGAQLETGTRASSYIKTVASTATRAADSASMTGTNFSQWFNAAEGTFSIEFQAGGAGDEFPLSVGQENVNEMAPYRNNSVNDMYLYVTASSVTQTNISIGDYPTSGGCKFAMSYGSAAFNASVDGAAVVGATPVTVPTVAALYIGGRSPGTNPLNGTIKRLAYYPKRLTNGNLQELTA